MNHIYAGDHPAAPHEFDHECPRCGNEFDTEVPCPECAYPDEEE